MNFKQLNLKKMKTSSLEQMEKIEGAWNMVNGCRAFAVAVVAMNDIEFGTVEAAIVSSIAFSGCMEN